jgi:plastocyanin
MNEIMEKVFRVADIRKFEQQVTKGDISYSRMVELMNEMAHTHYVVNKNCNLQNVNRRYSPEEGKVRGGSTIKWETFTDESYHNMVAVRPVGDTDFNSPRLFHFIFPENAEKFKLLAEMAFVAKPNGG